MAGLYIHIPFCKTRCIYCDFYSTTLIALKRRFVDALCQELRIRAAYLQGAPVETIYFGGGTPSQLDEGDLEKIFATIESTFGLNAAKEITLEANPDDLTDDYAAMLSRLPINRVSMGIQTFDDGMLRLLNRRHTSVQAIKAVERCRHAGIGNISIDLIYGLPGETEKRWTDDLRHAVSLDVEHISAYHLTYEEGTPLYKMRQSQRVKEVDEECSLRFFSTLVQLLSDAGYVHYEISNFCKPGMYSRHNSSYWQGIPYLGCGPSAHSFDTRSREWNVPSLEQYLKAIENGKRVCEAEQLDLQTRYNEYVMTGLRTIWGISLKRIEENFGPTLSRYCRHMAAPHIGRGKLRLADNDDILCLTREGIFVSDDIISDLMSVD